MPRLRTLHATDRVAQELAILDANEERIRLAMQAGRIYFWDWDVAEDYIVWFGGLERELLIDFAPSSADEFKSLVHPDDLEYVRGRIDAALKGPGNYEAEFRMVRKDGTIRWTSTRAIVIRDFFGFGVRMVGCDQDITLQKEALTRALESEACLKLAYDSSAAAEQLDKSGTWDWDIKNNRTYVSQSYRDLYGFDHTTPITYEMWLDRVHPEDRAATQTYREQLYASGSRYDLEFRIIHPRLGVRWIAGIGMLTRDADGAPSRFSGINVDITERKMGNSRQEDRKGARNPEVR